MTGEYFSSLLKLINILYSVYKHLTNKEECKVKSRCLPFPISSKFNSLNNLTFVCVEFFLLIEEPLIAILQFVLVISFEGERLIQKCILCTYYPASCFCSFKNVSWVHFCQGRLPDLGHSF